MTRPSNGALYPVILAARVSTNSTVCDTLVILVAFAVFLDERDLLALKSSALRFAFSTSALNLSAALIIEVYLLETI